MIATYYELCSTNSMSFYLNRIIAIALESQYTISIEGRINDDCSFVYIVTIFSENYWK